MYYLYRDIVQLFGRREAYGFSIEEYKSGDHCELINSSSCQFVRLPDDDYREW